MRVVYVTRSYVPFVGGAQILLQTVAERLAARGHQVTVLTLDIANERAFKTNIRSQLPPDEVVNGVRIIRVDPRDNILHRLFQSWLRTRGAWRISRMFLGQDFDFWARRLSGLRILRRLLRLDVDVIGAINFVHGTVYWAYLAARIRRIPFIAIPILHIEVEGADLPLYSRMLRAAAAVVVTTDAEGTFVRVRGARFVVNAGCGIDPHRFEKKDGAALRARFAIGDRPVVGFVGRQKVGKGAQTLIQAMPTVWQSVPDAVLLLAGPLAEREDGVIEALACLTPEARRSVIEINDFPNGDRPSIMDACDVLALPSVADAFGIVFLEAWICGKPVIGGDIPATRCVIDDGVDGMLVRPFDVDQLATVTIELLRDPAKRAALGEAGRRKVLSRYTREHVADGWEHAIQYALTVDRRGSGSATANGLRR